MSSRLATYISLLIVALSLGCSALPNMRKIDALITASERMCATAPPAQKAAVCRRALTCASPARDAQHATQTMLLVMAKMEDSVHDRTAAAAAYAGAIAACAVAGVPAGAVGGAVSGNGAASVPVAGAVPVAAASPAPAPAPIAPVVATPTTPAPITPVAPAAPSTPTPTAVPTP